MKKNTSFDEFTNSNKQKKEQEQKVQEHSDNKTMYTAQNIKGYEKIGYCKNAIEQSRVSLDKLKILILNGVKDRQLTENYVKLLEHRNKLIKEYIELLNEVKQDINK